MKKNRIIPTAQLDYVDEATTYIALAYYSREGRQTIVVRRSILNNKRELKERLLDAGILIEGEALSQAIEAIDTSQISRFVKIYSSAGFRDGVLLTRHGTMAKLSELASCAAIHVSDVDAWLQGVKENSRERGRWKKFGKEIRIFLETSPQLRILYSLSFVAVIGEFLQHEEPFGLGLIGESSTGKTTAQIFMQSLSAPTSSEADLLNSNSTIGAANDLLPTLTAQAACYAEVKANNDGRVAQSVTLYRLLYATTSGAPRRRFGDVEPPEIGYTTLVISSEKSILDQWQASEGQLEDGELVRFFELLIPPPSDGGIFSNVGASKSWAYSNNLKEVLKNHSGKIMRKFATKLVKINRADLLKRFEEQCAYDRELHPGLSNGFEYRILRKFSLIHFAAELLEEFGLLFMPKQDAHDAIGDWMMQVLESVRSRKGIELRAKRSVIETLLDETLIPKAKAGRELRDPLRNHIGFRRKENGEMVVYVRPSDLISYLNARRHPRSEEIVDELKRSTALLKDGLTAGEFSKPCKQKGVGGRLRYLRFNQQKLKRLLERLKTS